MVGLKERVLIGGIALSMVLHALVLFGGHGAAPVVAGDMPVRGRRLQGLLDGLLGGGSTSGGSGGLLGGVTDTLDNVLGGVTDTVGGITGGGATGGSGGLLGGLNVVSACAMCPLLCPASACKRPWEVLTHACSGLCCSVD